jgi:cytoskeletal protein CcmA (bactofilin family)
MFKKGELDESGEGTVQPTGPARTTVGQTSSPTRGSGSATIGPSIKIKGDVTGDEDLIIQGRIDGTVNLKKHNVTVGPEGRVKANIFGRSVIIDGEVEGDLQGEEQIVLRRTAKVQGNIAAPRVTLEDGATFRGGVDMQDQRKAHDFAAKVAAVGGDSQGKTGGDSEKAAGKAQEKAS